MRPWVWVLQADLLFCVEVWLQVGIVLSYATLQEQSNSCEQEFVGSAACGRQQARIELNLRSFDSKAAWIAHLTGDVQSGIWHLHRHVY